MTEKKSVVAWDCRRLTAKGLLGMIDISVPICLLTGIVVTLCTYLSKSIELYN